MSIGEKQVEKFRVAPKHARLEVVPLTLPAQGGQVDLSAYDATWYKPGGAVRRLVWYLCSALFFNSWLLLPSTFKCTLLRLFGARIGRGVVIKPRVNIKYPWFLSVGDHVWLGEGLWIDNLARVEIGSHVCVSQGAYLLTGNHDYKRPTFDLITKPIKIEAGAWVGAKAIVCPGVTLGTHAVISAGSVLQQDAQAYMIYAGNPAQAVRQRVMD
jgi:putative colanic acid biosynthesis acetyltransferase WcaF